MKIRVVDPEGIAKEPGEYVVKQVSSTDTEIVVEVVETYTRPGSQASAAVAKVFAEEEK